MPEFDGIGSGLRFRSEVPGRGSGGRAKPTHRGAQHLDPVVDGGPEGLQPGQFPLASPMNCTTNEVMR